MTRSGNSGSTPTLERVEFWTREPSTAPPTEDRFRPVVNHVNPSVHNKPLSGGMWTSPAGAEYGWAQWCNDNEAAWLGDRYVLTVEGEPRILVIDGRGDLVKAQRRWGRERTWGDRRQFVDHDLDFEAIAISYDALWLTTDGHFATRLLDLREMNTYSWDCETVLWFRWCFSAIEAMPPVEVPA